MISQAIALSVLTFTGFFIIFTKLPEKVKEYILKYSLVTDIVTLSAAYTLLGGTLMALFSSAIVGLMVSGALHIANHKEDFLYLWDLKDSVANRISRVKEDLKEYGERYREKKSLNEGNP